MGTNRHDWLFGTGATPTEKLLAHATAVLGALVVVLAGGHVGWSWWQWALGLALVWDLVGGVVANGLDTAKSFYHSPLPATERRSVRFMHHPIGFTGLHIQPILAGILFPGGTWWWGVLWYGWALIGAIVVEAAPERLQRPIALAVVVTGAMVSPLLPGPAGLSWLPVVLLLKLVLAHGVPEGKGAPHGAISA
ncbi:hypothetical protein DY245_23435 [Streptomyces inhibens]|uniref:Uncharacterized protein n=1 Tax=Streptomyces inhibens TaxID=2293571 RepID=A0A371Q055_STRIH|nr:hypothetical protein [Streptomyces inhibens]REK88095.1 hypothetical protein DY245_23435 [Streptomyces inhibens]